MAGGRESKSSSSGKGFLEASSMIVELDMGMSGGWLVEVAVPAGARVDDEDEVGSEGWAESED